MISKKVQTWLNGIHAKPKTRGNYIFAVNEFAKYVGKTPDEIIDGYIQDIKNGLLMPEREIFHDIPNFLNSLEERGLAPKTIHTRKAAIKSFCTYYYVEIPNVRIAKKKVLAGNANRFLEREQVRDMLEYAVHLRNRAIILTMSSSGMSSNEIRTLKMGQISFDEKDIGTVRLRRAKVEHDYFCFISPESTAILKQYWQERERKFNIILTDDDYVFSKMKENSQMSERAFLRMFSDINVRAGYEKGSHKRQSDLRSHAMRKFFSNTLQKAGMEKSQVDWLIGHVPDDVDSAYFNYEDVEKLKGEYIKYLPNICILQDIIINTAEKDLIEQQAEKIEALEKSNGELNAKMENLDSLVNAKIAEILKQKFEK